MSDEEIKDMSITEDELEAGKRLKKGTEKLITEIEESRDFEKGLAKKAVNKSEGIIKEDGDGGNPETYKEKVSDPLPSLIEDISAMINILYWLINEGKFNSVILRILITVSKKITEAKMWLLTGVLENSKKVSLSKINLSEFSIVELTLSRVELFVVRSINSVEALPSSKSCNMAITKLQEAKMWLESLEL